MFGIILPIIIVSYFLLGIFVFLKNPESKTNRTFSLLTFSISLWILFLHISDIHYSPAVNLLTNKLVFAIGLPTSLMFYLFTKNFPNPEENVNTFKETILWVITLIGVLVTIYTPLIVSEVEMYAEGINPTIGNSYYFIVIFDVGLLISGIKELYVKFRKSKGFERLQIQYMIAGFLAFCLIVFPLNLIIPLMTGSTETARYGPLGSILWFGFITYSIIQHRLLDLKYILEKVLTWIYAGLLGTLIFYIIIKITSSLYDNLFSLEAIFVTFVIIAVFAAIFIPLREYLTNNVFKKALRTDVMESKWDIFTHKLSVMVDKEEIIKSTKDFLTNALQVENIHFLLKNGKNVYDTRSLESLGNSIDEKNFPNFKVNQLLFLPEVKARESSAEYNFMTRYNFEVCIPIITTDEKSEYVNLLCLGERLGGATYTAQSLELLNNIKSYIENALTRANLYDILEEFNKTLERKVDKATIELRKKVNDLEEARRRERDMIDILGHELRTPMSIIKSGFGFLKILYKNKIVGKLDNDSKKKFSKYHDRVDENIEREINLIDTLLGATKLDQNKLDLSMQPVDLIDVIDDGLVGQRREADKKNLTLNFKKPKKFPEVFADRARIQEVMDNLLSNAVKYTKDGSVSVKAEIEKEMAKVTISDTGVGIPESAIPNLGKKFYRVKQYTSESNERKLKMVRSGGTGLGLYVTYGLIRAHKGKIWVESEVGKGTTFYFTLPLFKNQKIEKPHHEKDVFKRLGMKKNK